MKKLTILCFALSLAILFGCENSSQSDIETWKTEIREAEQAFNDMAQEKGVVEAFHYFAADSGVIRRNRKIIKGKEAIKSWYENDTRPNETLTWEPTFIDVSQSGDLAYTYGDYVFTYYDSLGAKKEAKGIFHTVWKRQSDGKWRFVWD